MVQSLTLSITAVEFAELLDTAIGKAINNRLKPTNDETLLTVDQASKYMSCSIVFLYKLRRSGQIHSVNAGKKILIPKSSIDSYLQLKKGGN